MGHLEMRVERAGHTVLPCVRQGAGCRHAFAGFTLVELLAVILIVGMLAAILTPVVMQSLTKARNTAIKAEIDMLHMAIMNYKNEHGSFPPAFDEIPLPPATPPSTPSHFVNAHIRRLYPRISTASPDNRANPAQIAALFDTDTVTRNPDRITNGLVWWLKGYSPNPTDPLAITSGTRNKMYDFDTSRVVETPVTVGTFTATRYSYHPSGKPGSPYVYLPASQYNALPYPGGSSRSYGALRQTGSGDPKMFGNTNYDYFHPDTFQILCAGRDEVFGTDDDLSNFWPGTRREYLDSLKK